MQQIQGPVINSPNNNPIQPTSTHFRSLMNGGKVVDSGNSCENEQRMYEAQITENNYRINSVGNPTDLTKKEYRQLMGILATFVNSDGTIDSSSLQKFIELGCTDGILNTIENVTEYRKNNGTVLKELAKYVSATNSALAKLSDSLEKSPDSIEKILESEQINSNIKNFIMVNNIVVAASNCTSKVKNEYPLQQLYIVLPPTAPREYYQPERTQPTYIPKTKEPFTSEKRINLQLQKEQLVDELSKEIISYWKIGEYAVVYEYTENSTQVMKHIIDSSRYDFQQETSEKLEGVLIDIPKNGIDTGTALDITGATLDIIGLADPTGLVNKILTISSLVADGASLLNDADGMSKNVEDRQKAIEHNIKVDEIKNTIIAQCNAVEKYEEQKELLKYSGGRFSAIYYPGNNGEVSLRDYSINTEILKKYLFQYNEKEKIPSENKFTEEDFKNITNGNFSELLIEKLRKYLKYCSRNDLV